MVIRNTSFSVEDHRGKDFEDVTFLKCIFPASEISFVSFQGCKFSMCDFSGCMLDMVRFSHCAFPESKLNYLDFSKTGIIACDFGSVIAKNCIFQQLKEVILFLKYTLHILGNLYAQYTLSGSIF